MQQGRYAGMVIDRRIGGKPAPCPFRYFDKRTMAVVGKGFAVLQTGRLRPSGFLAWLAWAAVHLEFLAQSNLRVSVFVQWVWTYVTGQRGSRLIVKYHEPSSRVSRAVVRNLRPAARPAWNQHFAVGRRLALSSTSEDDAVDISSQSRPQGRHARRPGRRAGFRGRGGHRDSERQLSRA
jgi:hypothetical protein